MVPFWVVPIAFFLGIVVIVMAGIATEKEEPHDDDRY